MRHQRDRRLLEPDQSAAKLSGPTTVVSKIQCIDSAAAALALTAQLALNERRRELNGLYLLEDCRAEFESLL